jgi:hypothetical protein
VFAYVNIGCLKVNVYECLKGEAQLGAGEKQVKGRVADVCGVSFTAVTSIAQEAART